MKGCKKMAIFTNQAQLRYGNAVANSNVAVGEILEVLAATKTAVRKIMRCDSDSGKKLIKSMVLRTADRQGMC